MSLLWQLTSGSEGENSAVVIAAIVGGVLGALLILSVTVFMIITVTCLLKNHGGNYTCKKYVYLLYIFCIVYFVQSHACICQCVNAYDYHYNHISREPDRVITSIESISCMHLSVC